MNKKLSVSNTASELTAKPDTAGGLSLVDKRALPRALRNYLALQDFIDQARKVLPRPIYGYITGGVENNISLRGNREVFDEIGFVPKPLVDTTQRSMKTELFGKTYNAPFGFAPMGGTSIATYQGDLVLARGGSQYSNDDERHIVDENGRCKSGKQQHDVSGLSSRRRGPHQRNL
jgi:L-lactate dehydrogenase (cytochrome)